MGRGGPLITFSFSAGFLKETVLGHFNGTTIAMILMMAEGVLSCAVHDMTAYVDCERVSLQKG
jgi:hypothetical protein